MKPKTVLASYCDQCCNLVGQTYICPSCGMHLCGQCYNNLHPCTAELPEEDEVVYKVREPHELGR